LEIAQDGPICSSGIQTVAILEVLINFFKPLDVTKKLMCRHLLHLTYKTPHAILVCSEEYIAVCKASYTIFIDWPMLVTA